MNYYFKILTHAVVIGVCRYFLFVVVGILLDCVASRSVVVGGVMVAKVGIRLAMSPHCHLYNIDINFTAAQ